MKRETSVSRFLVSCQVQASSGYPNSASRVRRLFESTAGLAAAVEEACTFDCQRSTLMPVPYQLTLPAMMKLPWLSAGPREGWLWGSPETTSDDAVTVRTDEPLSSLSVRLRPRRHSRRAHQSAQYPRCRYRGGRSPHHRGPDTKRLSSRLDQGRRCACVRSLRPTRSDVAHRCRRLRSGHHPGYASTYQRRTW